jgi:hypothetical protein
MIADRGEPPESLVAGDAQNVPVIRIRARRLVVPLAFAALLDGCARPASFSEPPAFPSSRVPSHRARVIPGASVSEPVETAGPLP